MTTALIDPKAVNQTEPSSWMIPSMTLAAVLMAGNPAIAIPLNHIETVEENGDWINPNTEIPNASIYSDQQQSSVLKTLEAYGTSDDDWSTVTFLATRPSVHGLLDQAKEKIHEYLGDVSLRLELFDADDYTSHAALMVYIDLSSFDDLDQAFEAFSAFEQEWAFDAISEDAFGYLSFSIG